MNCVICGSSAREVKEIKQARYRDEKVEVERIFFRCEVCNEEFVTPAQMKANVRAVKNEIRRKYGLLSPERIAAIRNGLNLSQSELEDLVGAGPKVVVRWENGKVIQSGGHDSLLRLLERDPATLEQLRQIQQLRSVEQERYASSQSPVSGPKVACGV
jgi:HTH-type transcriptional regulator/antitoxin MqsA